VSTTSISAEFNQRTSDSAKFLYIPVLFGELKLAALVDTGSSINVLSKSMYDSISDRHKLRFDRTCDSEIRLASDDKIRIHGIAKLQAIIHSQHEVIEAYILPTPSHPLILGTEYLKANSIVLDFSDFSCNQKNVPIKTTKV
jgi:predicted aspartyl protease